LQQRIKNEDMGARWRGEGTKPIIVGGKVGELKGVPVVVN